MRQGLATSTRSLRRTLRSSRRWRAKTARIAVLSGIRRRVGLFTKRWSTPRLTEAEIGLPVLVTLRLPLTAVPRLSICHRKPPYEISIIARPACPGTAAAFIPNGQADNDLTLNQLEQRPAQQCSRTNLDELGLTRCQPLLIVRLPTISDSPQPGSTLLFLAAIIWPPWENTIQRPLRATTAGPLHHALDAQFPGLSQRHTHTTNQRIMARSTTTHDRHDTTGRTPVPAHQPPTHLESAECIPN